MFFAAGTSFVPNQEGRIRFTAETWREQGGFALLSGYSDDPYDSASRAAELSVRRAAEVKAALERMGVPGELIWIQHGGSAKSLKQGNQTTFDGYVAISLTNARATCAQAFHKLELLWFEQFCWPTPAAEMALCQQVLRSLVSPIESGPIVGR